MTTQLPTRDALAELIWHTSRTDEGTISATGANIIADAVLAALAVPATGEATEWEPAKWHELNADHPETGEPEGDTIRLAWDNGTVVIGRLTVPSQGSGHHQTCRMRTVFGGDTWVWPHGATLSRKAVEVTP